MSLEKEGAVSTPVSTLSIRGSTSVVLIEAAMLMVEVHQTGTILSCIMLPLQYWLKWFSAIAALSQEKIMVDDFDAFMERMLGSIEKKPLPFAENSGAGIALGLLPLASSWELL
nr:pantothenate kinase 2 [Ipomoea batatas]